MRGLVTYLDIWSQRYGRVWKGVTLAEVRFLDKIYLVQVYITYMWAVLRLECGFRWAIFVDMVYNPNSITIFSMTQTTSIFPLLSWNSKLEMATTICHSKRQFLVVFGFNSLEAAWNTKLQTVRVNKINTPTTSMYGIFVDVTDTWVIF